MRAKFIFVVVLFVGGILFFSSWMKPTVEEKDKFHVKGTIQLISAHCGGAAPTPDMRARERLPYAQPFTTVYFRDGNANYENKTILDSVTSDSVGNFSIDLAKGTYCIVEKYKTYPFKYPDDKEATWDTACYRNNFQRCDFVLDVTKNIDSVKIILAHNCIWRNPCVKNYHGPRPSSSVPLNGLPSGKDISKPK
jgi:hypothetical protein